MARLLNTSVLPEGYYAVPFLDREGPIEIDVGTIRDSANGRVEHHEPTWTPPQPGVAFAVTWPATDEVTVEVYNDEGDQRLVAAIVLVSPRNKDRPDAREAFATKCADHLRHGAGLVVVMWSRRGMPIYTLNC